MFTKFSPGTYEQLRQIHNKGVAEDGKLYYGLAKVLRGAATAQSKVLTYRGTHEGRLKEETDLISAESNIDTNTNILEKHDETLIDHNIRITSLELNKADKCFAIAMSIVLG